MFSYFSGWQLVEKYSNMVLLISGILDEQIDTVAKRSARVWGNDEERIQPGDRQPVDLSSETETRYVKSDFNAGRLFII